MPLHMPSLDIQTVTPVAVGLAVTYGVSRLTKIGSRDSRLPPGPPTTPIVGNLNMIPQKHSYIRFTQWGRQYGGIYSLKMGSSTYVVVSSLDAINEIFEANEEITAKSDIMNRRLGAQELLVFAPFGPLWRTLRHTAAGLMEPSAWNHQAPIILAESTQLLLDCVNEPEFLYYHLQRCVISTAFASIGGVRVPRFESPLRVKWYRILSTLSKLGEPGNVPPADLQPILKYFSSRSVPDWESQSRTAQSSLDEVVEEIVYDAGEREKQGKSTGCLAELLVQKGEKLGLDNDSISSIVAALLIGSTITTTPLLHFVTLFAAAYRQCQSKIHEELDRVVGPDRLPTLEDLPNLSYVSAFMKEVHRFRPVTPTGKVPHYTNSDISYQGYLIPKDSTLLLNIWSLNHDSNLFDDPYTFDPERFIRSPYGTRVGLEKTIKPDILERLQTFNFEGGVERCLGIPLTQPNLVVAQLFWGFDLSPAFDDQREITPDYSSFESGATLELEPFMLTVKPRSPYHVQVIRKSHGEAISVFDLYENSK